RHPHRRRNPDRAPRSDRDQYPLPRAQPGIRRHAERPDRRHRHRARRPPRTVRDLPRGPRMKAVILAAGYATRLRPLTDTIKKELLTVGGRPIIDWIVDRVEEVEEIDEIHVV